MKSQRLYLVMKSVVPILVLFVVHSVACTVLPAQTLSSSAEIEELKLIVGEQQRTLEQQQGQILALQTAMAEQKKILVSMVPGSGSGAKLVPAVDRKADNEQRAESDLSPVPSEQLA